MYPAIIHRGPHAYGWATWDGEKMEIAKYEGRADTQSAFATTKEVNNKAIWLIGHVRWATHGSPSYPSNNHPIIHKDIVLAHNGILSNWREILLETGREDPKAEVDSEAIAAAIAKWGHLKGLSKIKGDMAAVYSSVRAPDSLYITRNYGRPLELARTKNGSLVFASETDVIDAACMDIREYWTLGEGRLLKVRDAVIHEKYKYESPPEYWKASPKVRVRPVIQPYKPVPTVKRPKAKEPVFAPAKAAMSESELWVEQAWKGIQKRFSERQRKTSME